MLEVKMHMLELIVFLWRRLRGQRYEWVYWPGCGWSYEPIDRKD